MYDRESFCVHLGSKSKILLNFLILVIQYSQCSVELLIYRDWVLVNSFFFVPGSPTKKHYFSYCLKWYLFFMPISDICLSTKTWFFVWLVICVLHAIYYLDSQFEEDCLDFYWKCFSSGPSKLFCTMFILIEICFTSIFFIVPGYMLWVLVFRTL